MHLTALSGQTKFIPFQLMENFEEGKCCLSDIYIGH